MSFSANVKEELSRQLSSARHCQLAEMAAIISLCGRVQISAGERYGLKIHTENIAVARKYFTLVKKSFNINTEISVRRNRAFHNSCVYTAAVKEHKDAVRILQAVKLFDDDGEIREDMSVGGNVILQRSCCRRAFIRGAFLAAGSISDPAKSYHFEIVCMTREKAEQLRDIIDTFGLDARIVKRKNNDIVYIKEGSQIVDILNVMGAHISLMDLENVRILKDMRNNVNRKVNCETANINKTVSAAVRQIEDIKYIMERRKLEELSEGLSEIARLRLAYPEAALKELGEMLTPSVGKSGVNHRLRKLSEIADRLRSGKEEGL